MAQQDSTPKTNVREALAATRRGYGLVTQITPTFLPCALLAGFITALQPMAVLFFSARILNELAGARDIQRIVLFTALTIGISFVLAWAKAFVERKLDENSIYHAFQAIQGLQGDQFSRMDYPYTEQSRITQMLADMNTRARGNGMGLMNLYYLTRPMAENLFSILFCALLLAGMFQTSGDYARNFITSGWATAALGGLLILCLGLNALRRRGEQRMRDMVVGENARSNTAAWYYSKYVEADGAAKDIRLWGQRGALLSIFAQRFALKNWHKFFSYMGHLEGFSLAMLAVVSAGVYVLVGLRALMGMYEVGSVVQYVGAVGTLTGAIGTFVVLVFQLINNAPHIQTLLGFLDLPPLVRRGAKPLPAQDTQEYVFEFRDVSFRYPDTEAWALRELNMTLHAGRRLAVVGLNGSGKTTMIKLLCRLYDPTEGQILLNGVDIKEYDYEAYHALFCVVFQDFKLFPLSIGQNVAARAAFDPARVEACLEDAGFGARLASMPQGVDTILYKSYDEQGVQISGGEAQKIALARALYRDAPLVVLDEPTAALDPIAEHEVYTTFDKTIGSKTAVFISHRLSSCRFCHDIAVFEAGKLVQRGNHETLLAQPEGRYAELWQAQAQHYVDGEEGA